jgi:AcrR family transcriptional regulator
VAAEPRTSSLSTRELILREATRLFASRGYSGVSIGDIGAAAGISGPAIYRHFPGKDAVLATILVDISERLLDGARERLADAGSPMAAVDALIDFQATFALDQPELITLQDRDLHNLDADDRRTVRRLQRSYVELWVAQIRELAPESSAEEARATTHAVFGLLNSTPHSAAGAAGAAGRAPSRPEMATLLRRMALAAVLAGAAENG